MLRLRQVSNTRINQTICSIQRKRRGLANLFSISCFMSIPCFSRSSRWAKVQSTGSTGVSADGVFSLSALACSGWLNRNTWFFPMMIRLPGRRHSTKVSEIRVKKNIWGKDNSTLQVPYCVDSTKSHLCTHMLNFKRPHTKNDSQTWTKLDCVFNTLAIDVGFGSLAGHQQDDHFSDTKIPKIRQIVRGQEIIARTFLSIDYRCLTNVLSYFGHL